MPGLRGSASPARKSSELRGRSMKAVPVWQLAVPEASAATELMMQTLVGVLEVFGAGSGGPKKQFADEQVRWLGAVVLVPPGSATGPRVMMPVPPLQPVIAVKV